MVIGFKQKINGKPTSFKEKIFRSEKRHTIRIDKNDRWKKGKKIQLAYGVRTKDYECFLDSITCTQSQEIQIIINAYFVIDRYVFNGYTIIVDGKHLLDYQCHELIKNDGFCIDESRNDYKEILNKYDFLEFFFENGTEVEGSTSTKIFNGKIIGWSDINY